MANHHNHKLVYHNNNMPEFICMKCEYPMRMVCVEATDKGYDLRSYECRICDTTETFVVLTI